MCGKCILWETVVRWKTRQKLGKIVPTCRPKWRCRFLDRRPPPAWSASPSCSSPCWRRRAWSTPTFATTWKNSFEVKPSKQSSSETKQTHLFFGMLRWKPLLQKDLALNKFSHENFPRGICLFDSFTSNNSLARLSMNSNRPNLNKLPRARFSRSQSYFSPALRPSHRWRKTTLTSSMTRSSKFNQNQSLQHWLEHLKKFYCLREKSVLWRLL